MDKFLQLNFPLDKHIQKIINKLTALRLMDKLQLNVPKIIHKFLEITIIMMMITITTVKTITRILICKILIMKVVVIPLNNNHGLKKELRYRHPQLQTFRINFKTPNHLNHDHMQMINNTETIGPKTM